MAGSSSSGSFDVIVVGAGVLGLFHAYHAARLGRRVLLIERRDLPREASVRNFGQVVVSGMKPGPWLRRAQESAALYLDLAQRADLPVDPCGTLWLATTETEAAVLREFAELGPGHGYDCALHTPEEAAEVNPAVRVENLTAGLYFPGDLRVEPRRIWAEFIPYLVREMGVTYRPHTLATAARGDGDGAVVTVAGGETFRADHVFVCAGNELRLMFPRLYEQSGLQPCKLLMLRTTPQPQVRMTTNLTSGLTLYRYETMKLCPSWPKLAQNDAQVYDLALFERGIHLLFSRDPEGRIVIGDSHEYVDEPDDLYDTATEALMLRVAKRLVNLDDWTPADRWIGVYTGDPEGSLFTHTVDGRVHLITGIGGKGMTTGPAVARESVEAALGVGDGTR